MIMVSELVFNTSDYYFSNCCRWGDNFQKGQGTKSSADSIFSFVASDQPLSFLIGLL